MSRNGEHTDCHISHPAELLYCARPPPPPPSLVPNNISSICESIWIASQIQNLTPIAEKFPKSQSNVIEVKTKCSYRGFLGQGSMNKQQAENIQSNHGHAAGLIKNKQTNKQKINVTFSLGNEAIGSKIRSKRELKCFLCAGKGYVFRSLMISNVCRTLVTYNLNPCCSVSAAGGRNPYNRCHFFPFEGFSIQAQWWPAVYPSL